jgi:hypothetical protein
MESTLERNCGLRILEGIELRGKFKVKSLKILLRLIKKLGTLNLELRTL